MIDPVRAGPVTPIASRVTAADGAKPEAKQESGSSNAADASRTARVSVPRLLDLVRDLSRSGPPVDEVKIAQVRRAIADGSYKIDVDALARAIVGHSAKD